MSQQGGQEVKECSSIECKEEESNQSASVALDKVKDEPGTSIKKEAQDEEPEVCISLASLCKLKVKDMCIMRASVD